MASGIEGHPESPSAECAGASMMVDLIVQGTPEWHEARRGKVTSSRVVDVCAKIKSGAPAATRANYMAQLLLERITGRVEPTFQSRAMQDGIEREPEAREIYAFLTDVDVEQVGFVDHPTIPMAGSSPDGLVGADGGVEFKCPFAATHLETLFTGKVHRDYAFQIQWNMAVTGRRWWDYVSFHPSFPEHLRVFIKRVPRDQDVIDNLETEVRAFQEELALKIAALKGLHL